MAGISLAVKLTVLPAGITSLVDRVGVIIWVISLTIVAAKIASGIIKSYSDTLKTTTPITSLTTNVVNIIVFIIGFLILMNLLGISITPIITALGIGGLAVALALQDTLSNLFAGIHTIMSKQVKVGDYVQMDSGQEGYVIDIGWRTTRIKTLPNNTVIIPNVKLSQAIVTNYYVPSKELAVLVQVGVHYNSDLEKVEKIT
ncbi:MAG: mechanosensitive ion channel family protein, partial [Elusimicrobia bacterium]|nr:mechanosensitive ion channel family protein [Elusimicrobiota bacterium]